MYKHGKIVVAGGLGFIGKNFCNEVSECYQNKFIFDKVTYASDLDFYYQVLKQKGWRLIVADIYDISKFSNVFGNNALVVNFAAESHVDASFQNVDVFTHTNSVGVQKVIDFCLSNKHRLLHISTDEVYGEQIGTAVDESHVLVPTNPYSATKAAGDLFVQTYIRCFNLDAKIVRANNIYGPRQLSEKVIPKAIIQAKLNSKFYIHGKKEIRRHFLHTSDFNNALNYILSTWELKGHKIFNVGSKDDISIKELVNRIYGYFGADPENIIIGKDRPFNDQEYSIDDQRLRSLGWTQLKNLDYELKRLCKDESYIEPRY